MLHLLIIVCIYVHLTLAQLQELEVFQHNYHNLVSILPEEIGPLFVAKQIISVNSFNAIRGGTKKDVIMALLEHVSSPLIAGDVNPFNEMLSIMTNYVTEPVKNLAYRMATELGQSKYTCISVQYVRICISMYYVYVQFYLVMYYYCYNTNCIACIYFSVSNYSLIAQF